MNRVSIADRLILDDGVNLYWGSIESPDPAEFKLFFFADGSKLVCWPVDEMSNFSISVEKPWPCKFQNLFFGRMGGVSMLSFNNYQQSKIQILNWDGRFWAFRFQNFFFLVGGTEFLRGPADSQWWSTHRARDTATGKRDIKMIKIYFFLNYVLFPLVTMEQGCILS